MALCLLGKGWVLGEGLEGDRRQIRAAPSEEPTTPEESDKRGSDEG